MMDTKHLISIYLIAMLVGSLFAALYSEGAWAAIGIAKSGPSMAISNAAMKMIPSPWTECIFTFLNNSIYAVVISLGLIWMWEWKSTVPILVFSVVINGLLMGVVGVVGVIWLGLLGTLALILPHGVLEMSAIVIVWDASLSGIAQIRETGGSNQNLIIRQTALLLLKICLPLLAVAAIIETFLTPVIFTMVH